MLGIIFLTFGPGVYKWTRKEGKNNPCGKILELETPVWIYFYLNIDTDEYTEEYVQICLYSWLTHIQICLCSISQEGLYTNIPIVKATNIQMSAYNTID